MISRVPAAGLILGGGGSRRMGGRKLDLPWGNGTLLSNIVEVMAEAVSEVWLVGYHPRSVRRRPACLQLLVDELRVGPAGGLLLGLETMISPVAVVTAADMPFVDGEAIRRLWELSQGAMVTVLRTCDGLHPLFGVYDKECLPPLRAAVGRGDFRMTAFWNGLSVRIIDVGDDDFWNRAVLNINSADDYRRALSYGGSAGVTGRLARDSESQAQRSTLRGESQSVQFGFELADVPLEGESTPDVLPGRSAHL